MNSRKIEILVGFFVTLGVAALAILALKVANAGLAGSNGTYSLQAKFENIGSLKTRAPIKVGGVVVGRVEGIRCTPVNLFLWLKWPSTTNMSVSFPMPHRYRY